MRISLTLFLIVIACQGARAQMRPDVAGTQGAVTSDHPLATNAGADVLRRGGNAIDAAITMAGVLAVVRPHMNGIGGDAFLLYRDARNGKIYALNGSGRAGTFATRKFFQERGLTEVPDTGLLSVTVPGAVRAWSDALRRFGTINLAAALEPAIRYAENGFPVSRKLNSDFAEALRTLERDPQLASIYLPDGKPPEVGAVLQQKDLANTLRVLAQEGADALYAGSLAKRLAEFSLSDGGLFTWQDFANHSSTWQEPIATGYHDVRVHALPPNSQGIALLMQLNVAEEFDLEKLGHNTSGYINTLVEVKRRVFADRDRFVADPAFYEAPLDKLLGRDYARNVARSLHTKLEAPVMEERNGNGDTVVACAVDKNGNAVVLIQSLFSSFGSGRMVPGTGIILHNRGSLFTLSDAHVNLIAPNKRPYHTLAPALVTRGDDLLMVVGTPGGDGQTQTIVQVLNNILLFGMTPQEAVDAPRYLSAQDGRLLLDAGVNLRVRSDLAQKGYRVVSLETASARLGGAQVILLNRAGVKMLGADHRREAFGIAW